MARFGTRAQPGDVGPWRPRSPRAHDTGHGGPAGRHWHRRARGRSCALGIEPRPVVHTSHPTYGYVVESAAGRVAWAPEFWTFPRWAAGVDVMFAEAAGWDRPIRFAGGVGGHAPVSQVAADAQPAGVRCLVLAHIGRPTIRAVDAGALPPYGELGEEGRRYVVRRRTKEG